VRLAGKTFASVCALVALAVTLLATAAAGHGRAPTRVHIRQVSGRRAFHGRVISNRWACLGGRRVRLYHEMTGSDPLVATTSTHRDGTWRAMPARRDYRPASYYYARIAPERAGRAACAGAKSAFAEAY
jgi:hypothetical protein